MNTIESVASYPWPPKMELNTGGVAIYIQDELIAEDDKYIRVCETFHPPSIYIEPSAFKTRTFTSSFWTSIILRMEGACKLLGSIALER